MSITSSDEDDPNRPLLGNAAGAGPITDISYGTIDEDPASPGLPSMVRTPHASAAIPRAPTPTEEALHAAYTEHPIVGSFGAVKNSPASNSPTNSTRREGYENV